MSTISFQIIILTIFAFIKVGEGNKTKYDVTIEVLTILDKKLSSEETDSIFSRKFRYCDLFQEVQKIFDTIEEVKIKINLSGLKIITKKEDQFFLKEKYVTLKTNKTFMMYKVTDESLTKFQDFLQKQSWYEEYDVILFLTWVFMDVWNATAFGLAFGNGCNATNKFGVSQPVSNIIAHEIGHLLGAPEDKNFKLEGHPCYEEGVNYIMSFTRKYKREFSKCSILSFQRFLNSSVSDCLRINNGKDTVGCNRNEYCPDFCIPSTSASTRYKRSDFN